MTALVTHWAAHLIGLPWMPNACGPHAYCCWGLVRHVFQVRHGVQLPHVEVGSITDAPDNAAAMKRAAELSGWRRAEGPAQADDVVLMHGPSGRHVGVIVEADGRLGVLHADGHMTLRGPVGSVVWQTLAEATDSGYGRYELWRRA